MRHARALVMAVPLVAAVSLLGPAGHAADDTTTKAKLPSSMHGAVETEALVLGNGGLSLFVDPGTAYASASLDYTRLPGADQADTAMKAVGAIGNPGTIGGAVLWAPPACEPQPNAQCTLEPTGLHEASGFPGYSEAFVPVFEGSADRRHTYKCVWNKDANGANPTGGALASTCKNDAEAAPGYAAADTWDDRFESRGFARIAGATGGEMVSVGASEGMARVTPTSDGKVLSTGYAVLHDVTVAGVITIKAVSSAATVLAAPDAAKPDTATASCTIEGLSIGGQDVDLSKGLDPAAVQPLLDQLKPLGYDAHITAPPAPKVETSSEGKHTAECTGFKLVVADVSPESRVSERHEFTFGFIKVSEAVTNIGGDLGGSVGDLVGSTAEGAPVGDFGGPSSDVATGADTGAGAGDIALGSPVGSPVGSSVGSSAAPSSGRATYTASSDQPGVAINGRAVGRRGGEVSTGTVAALTAAAATAIGAGVWLLVGVVLALAQGTRLRLPGTRLGG